MKRMICFLLTLLFSASACAPVFERKTRCAEEELSYILEEKGIAEGIVYSTSRDAAYPLTDAIMERLFLGANREDLCFVRSAALYVSRRFTEKEIFVLELYDRSHLEAVKKLLMRRAEKKENAVLSDHGVYLYLICE